MIEVSFRYIQTIVFPYMCCQSSVLLVVIVTSDQQFRRPVEISQIKRLRNTINEDMQKEENQKYLECLETRITDIHLLQKRTMKKNIQFRLARVRVYDFAELHQRRRRLFAEFRLLSDNEQQTLQRFRSRKCRVRDCISSSTRRRAR